MIQKRHGFGESSVTYSPKQGRNRKARVQVVQARVKEPKEPSRTNVVNFSVKWEEGQAEDKRIKGGYRLGGWEGGQRMGASTKPSWAGDHKFVLISACMDLQWLSSSSMKNRQRRGKDGE